MWIPIICEQRKSSIVIFLKMRMCQISILIFIFQILQDEL